MIKRENKTLIITDDFNVIRFDFFEEAKFINVEFYVAMSEFTYPNNITYLKRNVYQKRSVWDINISKEEMQELLSYLEEYVYFLSLPYNNYQYSHLTCSFDKEMNLTFLGLFCDVLPNEIEFLHEYVFNVDLYKEQTRKLITDLRIILNTIKEVEKNE